MQYATILIKENAKMTQNNYAVPPTKLMVWYENEENKTAVQRAIIEKADVSYTMAMHWLKGRAKTTKSNQLEVLASVSGIAQAELFELVKNNENE